MSDTIPLPDALDRIRMELRGRPVYWPRTPPKSQDEANAIVGEWISDLYALAHRLHVERWAVGAQPPRSR